MSAETHVPSEIEIEVEVRYAETDQMGVVHHSNYLVWCELGRTRLCSETGFHYRDIEEMGYQLLVTAARLEYRNAARYGDVVTVRCGLARLTSRGLTFGYRIFRDSTLLVRGHTEHVWLDIGRGAVCRIPPSFKAPFEALL